MKRCIQIFETLQMPSFDNQFNPASGLWFESCAGLMGSDSGIRTLSFSLLKEDIWHTHRNLCDNVMTRKIYLFSRYRNLVSFLFRFLADESYHLVYLLGNIGIIHGGMTWASDETYSAERKKGKKKLEIEEQIKNRKSHRSKEKERNIPYLYVDLRSLRCRVARSLLLLLLLLHNAFFWYKLIN
mgnify:CR=1 FL=1